MLNPNRRVDQNHAGWPRRRLRIGRSPFSVPPSSAKRRALALAIRASNPRRTSEVFSLTPVSLAACRKRESLMLSVVLICISMRHPCIQVKLDTREITIEPTAAISHKRCQSGSVWGYQPAVYEVNGPLFKAGQQGWKRLARHDSGGGSLPSGAARDEPGGETGEDSAAGHGEGHRHESGDAPQTDRA